MRILSDFKDFFNFIKKPSLLETENSFLSKARILFSTFMIYIIVNLILVAGLKYTSDILGLDLESLKNMSSNLEPMYNPIVIFLMVAVFEEFAFRGLLHKFNPLLIAISISGIVGVYFKKITYHNMFFDPSGMLQAIVLITVVFIISFFLIKKYRESVAQFWKNHFNKIVLISAFIFAFIHFFNAKELNIFYLSSTIIQFVGALIFSFARMRSGIISAIILHFIWNSLIGLG